jgi:hypothetical protein
MAATVKSWAAGVAVAVAVSVSGAGAQSWPCGASGSSLTCTKAGDTLTVSGTGRMEDYAPNNMGGGLAKSSISATPAPWNPIRWVVIGNGVTYIGKNTFDNTSVQTPMVSVKVDAESPPSVGDSAFFQGRGTSYWVSLFVPQSSVTAYKTASVWKDFVYINPSTVTFSTGNGSAIPPKLVSYGDTVAKPADPVRDGYVLDYWFLDAPPSNPLIAVMPSAWDFSTPITSDITLIAYWKTATSVLVSNAPKAANIAVRQTGRELKISTPDRAAASRYGVELYSVSGKRQKISPVYHNDGVITVALPHVAAGSYILRVGGGKSGTERRVLVR